MQKAKTSEALLRAQAFEFEETIQPEGREVDIYRGDGQAEIHVTYDIAGTPVSILACAPSLGITEIAIETEDGRFLEEDGLEAMLYELIEGDQLMQRMSGISETEPDQLDFNPA